jgi:hypothetical protein
MLPRGDAATAEMAPCWPRDSRCNPSTGSTARSTSVCPEPRMFPTLKIPGLVLRGRIWPRSSSRSSLRIATHPETPTWPNSSLKTSVARVYAFSGAPEPSRRATPRATCSVTEAYAIAEAATLSGRNLAKLMVVDVHQPPSPLGYPARVATRALCGTAVEIVRNGPG